MFSFGKRRGSVWAISAAVLIAAPAARAQVTQYSVTDLGVLPGHVNGTGRGISESGLVTGDSSGSLTAPPLEAFIWNNGVVTPLGFFPASIREGASSNAINDAGQVIGGSRIDCEGRTCIEAVLYQGGTITGLGDLLNQPGSVSSSAQYINNLGQIVGSARSATGTQAFLWQSGTMSGLGYLSSSSGFRRSSGAEINSAGHVAGTSTNDAGQNEAFLWDGATMIGLGRLSTSPLPRSDGHGLNNSDQVVGTSWNASGVPEAFLWEAGVMAGLGFLHPSDSSSIANDINDSGQIVGRSHASAFLHVNGTMHDLNALIPPGSGWLLQTAFKINNAGQIVGTGRPPQGFQHGFLLTPLPNTPPTCAPSGSVPITIGQDGTITARLNIGEPFVLTLTGDDPDDVLTVSHLGLPGGTSPATLSFTNGPAPVDAVLAWTPDISQVGLHQVDIVFVDSSGDQATCTVILEVVNRPPTCTLEIDEELFPLDPEGEIGPDFVHAVTVTVGQTFTAVITGDDLDPGDGLTLNGSGLPNGATLTPPSGTSGAAPLAATFEWAPTVADVGTLHVVTVAFEDSFGEATPCVLEIVVNRPPVAVCGSGQLVVECTSPAGADVTLDGTGSFDLDGDDIAFKWDVSYTDVLLDDQESPTPTGTFPIGVTMATLTVTDGRGGVSTCDVLVNVQDTTPPEVMVTTDVAALWPPKHDMRAVTCIITTSDVCENPDPTIIPLVVTVRSDEPDNATGNGDGNTTGDVNGSDGFTAPVDVTSLFSFDANLGDDGAWVATIQIRAERDGTGDGRAYVIDVIAFDTIGNVVTTSCVIVVPHDRRR